MNNRYLYRAKHIHALSENEHLNGLWIIGYLSGEHHISNKDGEYLIDPSTICQCTGLKDKNGKLIWENDIVWDSEERKFYQIIFSQEDMCYYEQDADGYKHTFESCYGSSIEVESNIFDNPELLEVGE